MLSVSYKVNHSDNIFLLEFDQFEYEFPKFFFLGVDESTFVGTFSYGAPSFMELYGRWNEHFQSIIAENSIEFMILHPFQYFRSHIDREKFNWN